MPLISNYTQCIVEPEPESEGRIRGSCPLSVGGAVWVVEGLFIGAEKAASINALVPAQLLRLDNGAVQ